MLLLLVIRAETLDQTLNLLLTATASHRRIGLLSDLFHGRRAVDDSIDDIYLEDIITGTQVTPQIFLQDRRQFIQRIVVRIFFQNTTGMIITF